MVNSTLTYYFHTSVKQLFDKDSWNKNLFLFYFTEEVLTLKKRRMNMRRLYLLFSLVDKIRM